MSAITFEEFKTRMLHQGFDEVLVREWAPFLENEAHTHPFDVDALIVEGDFWLTCDGKTTHLRAGDTFTVARDTHHSEKYGAKGCVFWAARKSA